MMTPDATAAITIGSATTIAVSYLFEALLALAFGWAGWQFREARKEMERLRASVTLATTRLELLTQWKDLHDQRDQERHEEVRASISELWGVMRSLPRTTVRGNGT